MKNVLRKIFTVRASTITFFSTALVIVLFIYTVPILDLIELKTYDLRFLSRGSQAPSGEVLIADIDEKSLDKEGRWPWPRSKIARLIRVLSEDGAKVIGFDVGFLEPDENSTLKYIEALDRRVNDLNIKNEYLGEFIRESKRNADNDSILAEEISSSKTPIVLGYFFHLDQKSLGYRLEKNEIDKRLERLSSSRYTVWREPGVEISLAPRAYAPEGNLEIFTSATDFSGYFNVFPDKDGVVRWIPLTIQCGKELFPPLSLLCVWHYLNRPSRMVKVGPYGIEGIKMGKRFISTDETGSMLINFRGPSETFTHYSITDILNGALPENTFKDKIVLVGPTADGLYDLRNIPFSPVYPGVEVHATVIDNILNQDFLNKPRWAKIYDLIAIIVLCMGAGFALPRLSAMKGILFVSALFLIHLMIARWLFISAGMWLNVAYPLFGLSLIYTALTLYHYMTEERERKKIKGAFSFYVSKSVMNEMLQNPDRLKLGGDKRDLTVLFSDIRGFTGISEGMSPEELVALLNEYLTVMTDIVFKYEGTLDKYMGDAIMAIYGAPIGRENHPASACHSALHMMTELKRLNEKWIKEGKNPVDIGIGINTGMMMVGNMGSEQRFDYTVMGDAVNLGSRLEGANKEYRSNILISEATYKRVKDEFTCMEVDTIRVKGKHIPVKIFQLLGHDKISSDLSRAVSNFQKGLESYKKMDWDEAISCFGVVKELDRSLHVSEEYVRRCEQLKKAPPPEDWDGIFTMKTK
ncbi:CHASE2 domain-containing protein [Thermodesulfobacteriota bacterium]